MTTLDSTIADPSNATPAPAGTTADPSPVSSAEIQAPASPGDTPASTPDAPVDDRASLLKIVREVVQVAPKTPLQGEGSPTAPGLASPATDPALTPAAPDPLESDPTDDEIKALVPRTKARVERLLAQRNEARTQTESLKPDAAKWQQMDGYLRKHDLAAEDANLLLGVGAALRRGDFKGFLDGVMPYVDLCREGLGISLPKDIQGKVDAGDLSVEAATELSVTRFANSRLQGQAKANSDAATAAQAAEAQTRTANAVGAAVVSWEQSVAARDPDYAKKAPHVERVAQALIAQYGRPGTPDDALVLAKRAYEEVSNLFAAARPAPVATLPQPSGARAVGNTRPEPKSLMEAAMGALEKMRG